MTGRPILTLPKPVNPNRRLPHKCHWPDCRSEIPRSKWGCRPHWKRLPAELRAKITQLFRTAWNVEAENEVQQWIRSHLRGTTP